MTKSARNRPFKFGSQDRRIHIAENSEVGLRAENDANGNPIFLGKSKVGTRTTEEKWQIRKINYDAQQGVLDVLWPENDGGHCSSDYEFVWDDRAGLTFA